MFLSYRNSSAAPWWCCVNNKTTMAVSINNSAILTTQTASHPAFNSSGINIFMPPGQHKHGMEVLLLPPTPAIGGCGFFGYQFKSTLPTSTWQHQT
jgi:hypothetical protein